MIRTWLADIRALYDEECYQKYFAALPAFRQEKARKLLFQKDRAQSAGAWLLLEEIRKRYKISDRAVYNLSHSGDYVLCSIDTDAREGVQLGCDIEKVQKARMGLAKRFFCRSEYEDIFRCDSKEARAEKFCRYWVLKESFMKATRKGMALKMSSFEILLSNPPRLIKKPEEFEETYYYCEYPLEGFPYRIAVCSNDSELDSRIQMELKEIWQE